MSNPPLITDPPGRIWMLFWLAVFTAHATMAAGAWWMLPHGFSPSHSRFWVNQTLPFVVIAIAILARWAGTKGRWNLAAILMPMFPALWIGAAITAAIVFPVSFRWLWIPPMAIAILMIAALQPLRKRIEAKWRTSVGFAAFASAVIGSSVVLAQRAPDPQTRPLYTSISPPPARPATLPSDMRTVRLSDAIGIEPSAAVVNIQCARVFIGIQPVLSFISRSPDRSWIAFATRTDRNGPLRRLTDFHRDDTTLELRYLDDTETLLKVTIDEPDSVAIESLTHLPKAIYSHLNTFCELTIAGHRKLQVAFSPCPNDRIDITYGEYPDGLPRRCAYLTPGDIFRIVEANSGEKGPFTTLAEGTLHRDEPLKMTFYDEETAICEITFDDFVSQADTTTSPTAGWGLPCNAIEFSLQGDSPTSAAGVFISLSGTSVGRGFDTVGHAPGTYRNRMRVRILDDPAFPR